MVISQDSRTVSGSGGQSLLESMFQREVSQTGFSLPGSGICLLGSLVFFSKPRKISVPAGGSSELWRAGRRKGKSKVLKARPPGSLAGEVGTAGLRTPTPSQLLLAWIFPNVKL